MIRTICRILHIPYRPAHSPDGPLILYTAAQVAARRALWARIGATMLVCTVTGVGFEAARHAPPEWLGIPPTVEAPHPVPVWQHMPPASTWRATGEPVHAVPEPASAALLGAGAVALWWRRRR